MKDLLKRLTDVSSPSSREENIRNTIKKELKGIKNISIQTDVLGNLIVHKKGTGKRILMAAHMDEIGFMISHIDKNGFLRFAPIGGLFPFYLQNVPVIIDNKYPGIIYREPKKIREGNVSLNDMYIDAGFENKKEAEKSISIGSTGTYRNNFAVMGNKIVSKAMDDRVACAILIEAIKNMPITKNDLYFVFTVQEETGLKGGKTSAYQIDPDIAIAVDVTGSGDVPGVSSPMEVYLGKGPAIKVLDGGMIADKDIVDLMVKTAKKIKIPYQMEILKGGTTDAMAMQTTKGGVKSGCISIPSRNIHSPQEIVDIRDVNNAVKLLLNIIK